MFSISSSEIPEVPSLGNWQKGKEKERVEEQQREEEVGAVEKTEKLWMKRMESLESVGLYLMQVA